MDMRIFTPGDIACVRDMFCEAFELDCYSKSSFVMRHLLDHYLCCYLSSADYTVVLTDGSRVCGFLVGSGHERKGRFIYRIMKIYHSLFLPFSHGGRGYIRCKRLISAADESLRDAAPEADSELMLIVVDKALRCAGHGRHMLRGFRNWLIQNGCRTMQLSTDDYCDVDYYRRHGYIQLGMRHIEFMPGIESDFYLFSIPVEKVGESVC